MTEPDKKREFRHFLIFSGVVLFIVYAITAVTIYIGWRHNPKFLTPGFVQFDPNLKQRNPH